MIILDFPPERLVFENPTAVLEARDLRDVLSVIADAEAHAVAGRYVAGFVSYDASAAFDEAFRIPGRADLPLAYFAVFNQPVDWAPRVPRTVQMPEWTPAEGRQTYDASVDAIREQIRNGDVYQVNHTLRLRADWTGDDFALYERLRAAQRGPYSAFFDIGRFAIASVSPELFFERNGTAIEARPMKGTARRGRWTGEDHALRDRLASSEKERAENVMIVDLLRNDIGRVARTGTVDVPALFTPERYPTVWQLTSTVRGSLRPNTGLTDVFEAMFPCGSVTGAPKVAATRSIAALESDPRGLYCGAIGLIRPGGDCVFNVAIRTVVINRESGKAEYGVGGGITSDSDTAAEYDELLAKAAILDGGSPPFSLLETMRLEDGAFIRRRRHVARLGDSADYFGFRDPVAAADRALADCAAQYPTGIHRVRLVVAESGSARTESAPLASTSINPEGSMAVGLAETPIDSRDPFLFHKTTHRAVYDRHSASSGTSDVLLWNDRGELTELTIGNLVVELDGRLYTPPRECGLLAGVFRAELLENKIVEERVLPLDDLRSATAAWRVSSLREWTPLVIPIPEPPRR